MKKVAAWLLVVALTAAIAVGGTLAYLTDTDEDVNVMTLGNVKIDQLEYERVDVETKDKNAIVQEFHDNKPLYPAVIKDGFDWSTGDANVDWSQIGKDGYTSNIWDPEKINNEQDKMVFVKNKGSYDAYVRSIFAFEANGYTLDQFKALFHLNINETDWTWKWEENPVSIPGEDDATTNYIVATATYNKVLKPGELTEISLSQIALDPTAGNEDIAGFGETYQILVKSQAVQTEGFENAQEALNKGFGEVKIENLPFENDSPILGIDLRTALHYYEGNTANQITGKVTNVIFGLNKDHPEILDAYTGTLVDVEQDVPVYAYYVPSGDTYTVYFLASDTIYSPKDSNGLFRNMKKLESVDTGNFDVSRVQTMRNMFRDCQVLKSLDTTTWDTATVKDMAYMFLNCYKLEEILGTENWDTGNVTTMLQTFAFCKVIKEIDASGWDTSHVTNMMGTFGQCFALENVDTTGWDTSSVTTTQNMFFNCYALKSLEGTEDWVLSSNTTTYAMFQNCYELTYLDATNWDLSNVTNMQATFFTCKKLQVVEGSENWNTGNVTTFTGLCENCFALTDLEVGTWDTGNVKTMSFAFRGCESLEELDIANWDTSNVTHFNSMFSSYDQNTGAMKLTELPVENWDVSSATHMGWMFYGCSQVKELDLSKWDVSKVVDMDHMFTDCYGLETVNFGQWDTSSLTNLHGFFNDCHSLVTVDVSSFDTEKVTNMGQLFEACHNLTEIIGLENFDTGNVTTMYEMFSQCYKLPTLDLSSFNTGKLTAAPTMFANCSSLKTIYVGDGWDMSKVTSSGSMFAGCGGLTGGNGTAYDGSKTDVSYACVDTAENPGYFTHINDKP